MSPFGLRFDISLRKKPSSCCVYTLLMRPFFVLKLNAMVSLSYLSEPIENTGVPKSVMPVVSALSLAPVACTKDESMLMCIRSAARSIFSYFTVELP